MIKTPFGLYTDTISRSEVDPGEDEAHPWPEWGEFDIIEWVHEEDEAAGVGDFVMMELTANSLGQELARISDMSLFGKIPMRWSKATLRGDLVGIIMGSHYFATPMVPNPNPNHQ